MGLTGMTVGKWRKRYRELGLEGLHDELRLGRPRTYEGDQVAEVINRALQSKPTDGSTRWSARSLAAATGISKTTFHRWLKTFSLQPHRQKTFKISTDPFFVEKVRDIFGLYLNPPDKAMVLCVDEKTQIQAPDRTQPLLPMGLGYVEGAIHDYIRHGTTTLFAALDVATGEVMTQCMPRHRHQEFLGFLRQIEQSVPAELNVHLIVDNYATHKHAKVRSWLAQRPRFHVHYTPTYASLLNQVERWFGIITQCEILRGSFSSVKELIARIEWFEAAYNKTTLPPPQIQSEKISSGFAHKSPGQHTRSSQWHIYLTLPSLLQVSLACSSTVVCGFNMAGCSRICWQAYLVLVSERNQR
jgi:putative transposase